MIVVGIVAISAALAAPAISRTMADRRSQEAMHSLVRIGARGRAEAMAYGRAHLLRYSDASTGASGDNGSVELWRGQVNLCTANDWATLVGGDCGSDPDCLERLDMGRYAYPTHQVRMRLPGASAANICFQPNGDMYFAPAGGLFSSTPPAGTDAIRFTIDRLEDGSAVGVQRAVVFPFGSPPRVVR